MIPNNKIDILKVMANAKGLSDLPNNEVDLLKLLAGDAEDHKDDPVLGENQTPELALELTGEDLNDLTEGFYYQPQASNAKAILHYPIEEAGSLLVQKGVESGYTQIYNSFTSGKMFIRVSNGGYFEDWKEILDTGSSYLNDVKTVWATSIGDIETYFDNCEFGNYLIRDILSFNDIKDQLPVETNECIIRVQRIDSIAEHRLLIFQTNEGEERYLRRFVWGTWGPWVPITTTDDLSNIEADIAQLKIDVTNLESDVANINTDITNINSSITTINGKISTIETDVTNLQSEVSSNYSKITAVEVDVVNIKSDITTLQSDVSTLQTDVAALQTDMTNVKADVATLNAEAILNADKASNDDLINGTTNKWTDAEHVKTYVDSKLTMLRKNVNINEIIFDDFKITKPTRESLINAAEFMKDFNWNKPSEFYVRKNGLKNKILFVKYVPTVEEKGEFYYEVLLKAL